MAPLESTIDRRSLLKLIGAAGAWPALAPTMSVAQADISRFTIHVSDDELADLRRRLSNLRWPPDATGKPWSVGTDRAYLQQLMAYWSSKDQILTLVSIYWHTRTIGTAMRIYYSTGRWRTPAGERPSQAQQQASATGLLRLLRHHLTRPPAEVARRQGPGQCHALVVPRDGRSFPGDRGTQASRRGSAHVLPTPAFVLNCRTF